MTRFFTLFLIAALLLCPPLLKPDLSAQNLLLDSTFNKTGKLVFDGWMLIDITLLKDGKIVTGNMMEDKSGGMYCIMPDGTLDSSYNKANAGPGFTSTDWYTRVKTLPDNSTLFLCKNSASVVGIVKMNPRGEIDVQFGSNGKLEFQIQQGETRPMDFTVLPNGKFLVAGIYRVVSDKWRIFLRRYLPNGLPDNSFGIKGEVKIPEADIEDVVGSMECMDNGKIMLAGSSYDNDLQTRLLQIIRLNENGSFDADFGFSGRTFLNLKIGEHDHIHARDFLVEKDGRITVTGYISTIAGLRYPFCVRLNPDGTSDTTFVRNKNFNLNPETGLSNITNILPAEGNKYFISGTKIGSPSAMAIARLNSNGTLDTTFNEKGAWTLDAGEGTGLTRMIKSPEGFIYISGIVPRFPSGANSVLFRLKAVPKRVQTVLWDEPGSLDCGVQALKLQAGSGTGLPVTYEVVSGPGQLSGRDTLLVSGIGEIIVSASVQGNDIHAPSQPRLRTFQVTEGPSCQVKIYDFVTPNNDGDNDFFTIENLSYYPGHQLDIYDRWGARLYSSSSYNNSWNGAELAEGVYYYTLEVKGYSDKRFKGTILIKR